MKLKFNPEKHGILDLLGIAVIIFAGLPVAVWAADIIVRIFGKIFGF